MPVNLALAAGISPGLRLGMPWTLCGSQACPPPKALLERLVFCVWRASEVCTQRQFSLCLWSCSPGGLCSEILHVMVTSWETTVFCSPCSRRAPLCFVWAGSSAYCSLLSSCWWGQVLQGGPRRLLDVVRGPQGPSRQCPPWKGTLMGTASPSGQDSERRWPSRAWPVSCLGSRAVLARPHHLQYQGPPGSPSQAASSSVPGSTVLLWLFWAWERGKKCPWAKSCLRQPENVVQGAESVWNELGVGVGGRRGEGSGKGGSRASDPSIFLGLLSSCTRMCAAGGAKVPDSPESILHPFSGCYPISRSLTMCSRWQGWGWWQRRASLDRFSYGSCCCCWPPSMWSRA